jgi:hypothetical protein
MSWVDVCIESNSENEAPKRFFYWSALAAISAVMKKQVFTDRFYYKLYPNIYVFLVARSGMKKGVPINMARNMVTKVANTRIISGRNSMQRIIQDLGKAHTLESGGMIRDAQGFLISGELAAFLVKDPDALTILTDLHDTHSYEDVWINSLKGSGVDKLKSPCITLLGATNEDHFSEAVPQNAIGGGFIARTFVVFSMERGTLNSLTEKPTKIINNDFLAEYLKELAKVSGEFVWTVAAKKTYDLWYYKFMAEETINDSTGTNNRLGDQIIKVAMLLSLAQEPNLILKESHIIEAIDVSMNCLSGMKQVTMGAGKSTLAYAMKLVMRELLNKPDHKMSKQKLLQKYWGEFDAFDLDRIVETLVQNGAIKISADAKEYTMQDEALKIYNQALRSIQ